MSDEKNEELSKALDILAKKLSDKIDEEVLSKFYKELKNDLCEKMKEPWKVV